MNTRKRKKELKQLQKSANNLWSQQQAVLGEAATVAREAGRQLSSYGRDSVVPAVQHEYEARVAPYVDRGVNASKKFLDKRVVPVVGGVVGTVVARMISKYDARRVMLTGAFIGSGALALLGQAREPWQLYVIYVFFAIGFSAAGLVPTTTVVTRWFHTKRSIALSVASTGLSVGGMILTPGAKWLTDVEAQEVGPVVRAVDAFVAGLDDLYLTIDLDVLPAAGAPGVSAPAAIGVSPAVILAVCTASARSGKLRHFDVVELNPTFDVDARTARTGARLVHELITQAVSAGRS